MDSANGLYKAGAISFSMKTFFGGRKEYCEFWVRNNATGDTIRDICIEPSEYKP